MGLQGERELASTCKPLGVLKLEGIKPAPRGVPQIEVVFDIDVNGILKVKATDAASQTTQDIVLENSSQLTEEEKEFIIYQNTCESLIYEINKILVESPHLNNNVIKDQLQKLSESLNVAIKESNREQLNGCYEQLKKFYNDLKNEASQSN